MSLRSSLAASHSFGGAALVVSVATLATPTTATASITHRYVDAQSGMSAEAEFSLLDPRTFQVRVRNTSSGVREDTRAADQILSAISWDFGFEGPHFIDPLITGGQIFTGDDSYSVNFDRRNVYGNEEVSGEWAYSNSNFTGLMQNFVTSDKAQATPFEGENLDGPIGIEGPAGGLIAEEFVPLGSLGAIDDEVIAILWLDRDVNDLEFLNEHGSRVEFGSDYMHLQSVPAPGGLALLGLAVARRRRRRR